MSEKKAILRKYFHGLTDEQFAEDISRYPLRDVLGAMDEYAHDRIRTVAHEAVEEEKAWTMYDECCAVDHVCDSILYRIKSKL